MAHAAVVSLIKVLENTQNSIIDHRHRILYEKQQIESLLRSLRSIAGNFPVLSLQVKNDDVLRLEEKIRDAAHKAEDLVESRICQHFSWDDWFMGPMIRKSEFKKQLEKVAKEIDSVKEEVLQYSDSRRRPYFSAPAHPPSAPPTGVTLVGLEDELEKLTDWLTDQSHAALRVIPIVGMVGSGKTTLARRLYSVNDWHFDVRAWVTVSQDYQPKKVLLDLLGCIKVITDEMRKDTYDLRVDLHRSLIGRRYLIVMDDVWGTEVLDDMRMLFQDGRTGSRILLTTRESHVAAYANSERSEHHHKRFLDDAESWDLMRGIVFRSQSDVFRNLEEVGRRIARSCKGLPLSIVVVSGLLSNVSQTTGEWESVARNFKSNLTANEQCAELLFWIYARLPHHLKLCLLYMALFPEDFEMSVSKLARLWIAEGFIEPSGSESLEEVGEKYLKDLISRNLILISGRSSGKIKTCSIHDLIREFCLRKAEEENFFHSSSESSIKDPRRICCHGNFLGKATFSFVRSLISVSIHQIPDAIDALGHCKLLRVLHMDKMCLKGFPNEIFGLICLSYVSLWCEEEEIHIPKYICTYLQNLQTLIILQSSKNNTRNKGSRGVHLPGNLWIMPKLRYLKFDKCYLSCSFWYGAFLESLHTLSKLSSSSCDVNFFKRTPNLKKLGVHVEKAGYFDNPFCLGNVGNLPQLEKLQVTADIGSKVSIPDNFTLPHLKKLTLKRTRLPWKDMSIVGSLPKLEELELINNAFQGSEWEPNEDGFHLLKSLSLDELDLKYWIADAAHFPNLVHLHIWECGNLKQISPGIGEIQTLETIELDDASPHAVTWAKDIQQNHQEDGDESFQVCFFYIWSDKYQQRKKAKEAYERRKEEKERLEEEKKRQDGSRFFESMPHGPRPSMSEFTRSDHGFDRPSFPHDGIRGPGIHRSFGMFDGPSNIRGTTPSQFGGSRI